MVRKSLSSLLAAVSASRLSSQFSVSKAELGRYLASPSPSVAVAVSVIRQKFKFKM